MNSTEGIYIGYCPKGSTCWKWR